MQVSGIKQAHIGRLGGLEVKVEEEGEKVKILSSVPPGVQLPVLCNVTIPIKFSKFLQSLLDPICSMGRVSDSVSVCVSVQRILSANRSTMLRNLSS